MEEKITLTEEQANRFMKEFSMGDLMGFEELYKILKEELKIRDTDMDYTIFDLLKDTISVNSLFVWGIEDTGALEEFYTEIETLYSGLKRKLFDSFTNDLDKLWEEYCM